jgi:hypothetical protein
VIIERIMGKMENVQRIVNYWSIIVEMEREKG